MKRKADCESSFSISRSDSLEVISNLEYFIKRFQTFIGLATDQVLQAISKYETKKFNSTNLLQ